jgi:type VI secretion system protein ImpM
MSEQAVTEPIDAPAWYGKLPGQGDFVGRRLPHALRSAWDGWLGEGLAHLRHVDPQAWAERFVQSPVWCFVAGPALSGTGMCGALAASMDRVGRCYPISVMALAPTSDHGLASGRAPAVFWGAVRDAIVEARRQSWTAEQFDARLAAVSSPFATVAAVAAGADQAVDALLNDLAQSGVRSDAVIVPDVASAAWVQPERALSVWWHGTPTGASVVEHVGAPDVALFARLFSAREA